jgi:hypothetical protein
LQSIFSPVQEQAFPFPGNPPVTTYLPTTAFVDTGTLAPISRVKTIYIVVSTTITQSSGQAQVTPYVSRVGVAPAAGAASALTAQQVKLTPQAFGASGTTILAGLYRISPGTIAELQWPDAYIGLEFAFITAATAGALAAYLESAP